MKKNVLVMSSLLATLMISAPSLADNDAFYPASFCEVWYLETGTPHFGENGRLANESTTSAMTVVCPIQTPHSGTTGTVRAAVRDDHSTEAVECGAYRQYYDSAARTFYNMGATNADSSSFSILDVSSVSLGYSSITAPYANYVVCSIPAKQSGVTSAIGSYSAID